MRRRWVRFGAALLLAAPLAWLVVQWARGSLVPFLWVLLRYAGLVIRSFPQVVYWIAALAIASLLAARSLLSVRQIKRAALRCPQPAPGPVQQLVEMIVAGRKDSYARWRLARRVGELVVEAVDGQHLPPAELRNRWLPGDRTDVPGEIQAYVRTGTWGAFWSLPRRRGWLARLRRQLEPSSPLDLDLERVVVYLEEQLQGVRDRGTY